MRHLILLLVSVFMIFGFWAKLSSDYSGKRVQGEIYREKFDKINNLRKIEYPDEIQVEINVSPEKINNIQAETQQIDNPQKIHASPEKIDFPNEIQVEINVSPEKITKIQAETQKIDNPDIIHVSSEKIDNPQEIQVEINISPDKIDNPEQFEVDFNAPKAQDVENLKNNLNNLRKIDNPKVEYEDEEEEYEGSGEELIDDPFPSEEEVEEDYDNSEEDEDESDISGEEIESEEKQLDNTDEIEEYVYYPEDEIH
ncbi:unnamed protein product [Caenorhabditis angaria]|uniref:Uncharacterized protein n=1 Tax=Caenorhabditis angaria TaxID=860376 RepID=A0A9P1IHG2_9PELO|nr:unnamed protein product [Caenorhabditis angaria]